MAYRISITFNARVFRDVKREMIVCPRKPILVGHYCNLDLFPSLLQDDAGRTVSILLHIYDEGLQFCAIVGGSQ